MDRDARGPRERDARGGRAMDRDARDARERDIDQRRRSAIAIELRVTSISDQRSS